MEKLQQNQQNLDLERGLDKIKNDIENLTPEQIKKLKESLEGIGNTKNIVFVRDVKILRR